MCLNLLSLLNVKWWSDWVLKKRFPTHQLWDTLEPQLLDRSVHADGQVSEYLTYSMCINPHNLVLIVKSASSDLCVCVCVCIFVIEAFPIESADLLILVFVSELWGSNTWVEYFNGRISIDESLQNLEVFFLQSADGAKHIPRTVGHDLSYFTLEFSCCMNAGQYFFLWDVLMLIIYFVKIPKTLMFYPLNYSHCVLRCSAMCHVGSNEPWVVSITQRIPPVH